VWTLVDGPGLLSTEEGFHEERVLVVRDDRGGGLGGLRMFQQQRVELLGHQLPRLRHLGQRGVRKLLEQQL
jgi:hypothetical protein